MAGAPKLRLQNSAREARDNSLWRWSVWLDAPDTILRDVKSVVYTLHPTFPDPVQTRTDWRTKFRLDSAGWGEFTVHARVEMKNGTKRDLKHWLKLDSTLAPPPGAAKTAAASPTKGAAPSAKRSAPSNKSAAPPASAVPAAKRVFISHSVSDRPFVQELRAHLQSHNVQAITAEADMPSGVPWERWLKRTIGGSDAVMVVLGQTGTTALGADAKIASAMQRRVIPVVVGSGAEAPPEFGDAMHVGLGPDAAATVAERVASMLT